MSGLIAIVGRPNVGKSALFNRIVGRRIAIVHDQPGVTRDRISAEAEWRGRTFTLVDTGGIGLLHRQKAGDELIQAAFEQVQLAIEAAQVILLVVNVQDGLVPLDREVADRLRRSGRPVVVAVNKVDDPKAEPEADDFARLGFDRVCPVSAIHGRGVETLLKAATDLLPAETAAAPSVDDAGAGAGGAEPPLKLAVVGRPNVGKSSLVNALTRSPRVIVSPVPGTTRDAIDVPFETEADGVRRRYVLIDTAGIRKTRSVSDSIEFFSVKRAEASIERADLVVFVLDAVSGILEQDKKIADRIVSARKGCILVVNKWDLFADQIEAVSAAQEARLARERQREGTGTVPASLAGFGRWIQEKLFFLDYAPVIFTSATSGFHLERLLETVRYVTTQLQQRVATALLNRTLHDAIEHRQPVSSAGSRLKFYYATQVKSAPPTFLLFVNRKDLFSPAYEKYLANEMRRAFGFEGCPIVFVVRPRPRSEPGQRAGAGQRPAAGERPPRVERPARGGRTARRGRTRG